MDAPHACAFLNAASPIGSAARSASSWWDRRLWDRACPGCWCPAVSAGRGVVMPWPWSARNRRCGTPRRFRWPSSALPVGGPWPVWHSPASSFPRSPAPRSLPLWACAIGRFPDRCGGHHLGVRARPHPAGKIGATTCMVLAITVLTSWRRSVKVPGWLAIADALCLADVAISRRGGRATARSAAQPGRAM